MKAFPRRALKVILLAAGGLFLLNMLTGGIKIETKTFVYSKIQDGHYSLSLFYPEKNRAGHPTEVIYIRDFPIVNGELSLSIRQITTAWYPGAWHSIDANEISRNAHELGPQLHMARIPFEQIENMLQSISRGESLGNQSACIKLPLKEDATTITSPFILINKKGP